MLNYLGHQSYYLELILILRARLTIRPTCSTTILIQWLDESPGKEVRMCENL